MPISDFMEGTTEDSTSRSVPDEDFEVRESLPKATPMLIAANRPASAASSP